MIILTAPLGIWAWEEHHGLGRAVNILAIALKKDPDDIWFDVLSEETSNRWMPCEDSPGEFITFQGPNLSEYTLYRGVHRND